VKSLTAGGLEGFRGAKGETTEPISQGEKNTTSVKGRDIARSYSGKGERNSLQPEGVENRGTVKGKGRDTGKFSSILQFKKAPPKNTTPTTNHKKKKKKPTKKPHDPHKPHRTKTPTPNTRQIKTKRQKRKPTKKKKKQLDNSFTTYKGFRTETESLPLLFDGPSKGEAETSLGTRGVNRHPFAQAEMEGRNGVGVKACSPTKIPGRSVTGKG